MKVVKSGAPSGLRSSTETQTTELSYHSLFMLHDVKFQDNNFLDIPAHSRLDFAVQLASFNARLHVELKTTQNEVGRHQVAKSDRCKSCVGKSRQWSRARTHSQCRSENKKAKYKPKVRQLTHEAARTSCNRRRERNPHTEEHNNTCAPQRKTTTRYRSQRAIQRQEKMLLNNTTTCQSDPDRCVDSQRRLTAATRFLRLAIETSTNMLRSSKKKFDDPRIVKISGGSSNRFSESIEIEKRRSKAVTLRTASNQNFPKT